MSLSATIPTSQMDAANAALEEMGFGPGNFSVPLRTGSAEATHGGFHAWDDPAFLDAVVSLQGIEGVVLESGTVGPFAIEVTEGEGVTFPAHVAARTLEWSDPADWFVNPIMKGDERTFNGKTWVSLVDINVWQPPVAWREVVSEGYPAWVQPTGAHDAYAMGDRVTHNGQDWENTGSAANVWAPGVFGWVVI